MSGSSTRLFLLCGTDRLQAGRGDVPSGNLVKDKGGPARLAVNRNKFWPAGKTIHVRFLNGSPIIQKKVKLWAQAWEEFANIDFKFMADDEGAHADIRVGFQFRGDKGTWSWIGKDAEKFVLEQKQPTMNFGELDDNSTESEVSHRVLHEFGHALGCVHEHQANAIKWNKARVISDCKARYKWTKEMTRQQILDLDNLKELTKSDFDPNSIMCYWFPPEWTLDNQSAPVNLVFSDNDKSFINKMYPFRTHNDGKLDVVPGIWQGVDNVVPMNSKGIDFDPPYLTPPRMALGMTQLDEANNTNIRVRLGAETITEKGFMLSMDTWADSLMHNAGATWLEFPTHEQHFQVGSYSTLEDRDLGMLAQPEHEETSGKIVRRDVTQIDFPRDTYAAGQPPKVLTWLTGLDLGKDANWRIMCYARAITDTGFELVIETWGDTICHSASASWVAHPADLERVQSGKVSSLDVRDWFPPMAKTRGKVVFAGGEAFDKTPKVFIGMSALDIDSAKKMRVKIFADRISSDGFTWHGESWDDSLLYSVGADWIAFG